MTAAAMNLPSSSYNLKGILSPTNPLLPPSCSTSGTKEYLIKPSNHSSYDLPPGSRLTDSSNRFFGFNMYPVISPIVSESELEY